MQRRWRAFPMPTKSQWLFRKARKAQYLCAIKRRSVGCWWSAAFPRLARQKKDAHAGALLSYGVSLSGALREVADYVARIAKGARPSDLPIAQPRSFELLVNIKTAKALGPTVPPSLLVRADEVIE
jgi:hypothetical protein